MYLGEKWPIYQSLDWASDGLKAARSDYIVTAKGRGVDVLDFVGTLLVRVQTDHTVRLSLTLLEGWAKSFVYDLCTTGHGRDRS